MTMQWKILGFMLTYQWVLVDSTGPTIEDNYRRVVPTDKVPSDVLREYLDRTKN